MRPLITTIIFLFACGAGIGQVTDDSLTVALQKAASNLDEVVVSGTMKAVKRTSSPVPVEVYTPVFFRKNPTPSIFEALQLVNGVRPQLNCNICNTGDIHINGLEGPYTLILIDGMPIVSSLSTVYGLSGIPNSLVERIEIVKGPASSLYGSEAIGGLINVITKDPQKAAALSADISVNSWNEFNADLGLKYKAGAKSTGLLGINYFNFSNKADKNNDGFTDVTLQDRISVFNKIKWNRKENRQANLAARYIYEERWGGETRWNKSFRGGDSVYGESIYTARFEAIGNYQLPTKEKLNYSYSLNSHNHRSAYGKTIFNARQDVFFNQLTWDKTVNSTHSLLAGIVAKYTFYDDNTAATADSIKKRSRPDKVWLPGIFVQDEISINSRQLLLVGARYDYDKRHGNIITPRIAYKISQVAGGILRLNAGTGFRVVNIFTEDHAALTGARDVIIKDKLKPERSYNANLNFTRMFTMERGWFNFDLSTWFTYFTNRIVPDYETNSNQIIYSNLSGHAISKGISLNTDMNLGNALKTTLGITLQDVSVTTEANGKKQRQQQLLTEKWSGTWTISYTFQKAGFTVDYTGNIYAPMRLPLLSATDPRNKFSPVWSIQNLQFTKKIGNAFEGYAGVKNLLNWTPAKSSPFIIARANDPFDKKVEYSPAGKVLATPGNPYALTFDPNYVYAPNQGIRAFLGLRYQIR